MPLCHDEWDYAMGFSRRDPYAGRRLLSGREREQREEQARYVSSLTTAQKTAYDRVNFFIAAVGSIVWKSGRTLSIQVNEVHLLFPVFAYIMGWSGKFYVENEGKCPAVAIRFPELPEDHFYFISVGLSGNEDGKTVEAHPERDRVKFAALEVCCSWLPDWHWERFVDDEDQKQDSDRDPF